MTQEVQPSFSNSLQLEILQQVSSLGIALGNLQGQANLIISEQATAAASRKAIYDKLSRLEAMEGTLARITPLVDKHEKQHNEAAGAMWLGKTLWAAGAGGVGAAGTLLMQWITGGRHP